jgi:hypothetical protein
LTEYCENLKKNYKALTQKEEPKGNFECICSEKAVKPGSSVIIQSIVAIFLAIYILL